MLTSQYVMDLNDEIIIDNFAGGGGASSGIELALGRHVDVAINHDPEAVSMHQANHPQTRHYCESVWEVDPRNVEPGRKIGLLWLSPDCKHFSKAKGGKPVEKKIRGLAWVAMRWVAIRKPRVIALENVEEFVTWGPLVAGEDGGMRPCQKNKGREFNAFVNALRRHGYVVDWKELRACDFGAPTIRKRLFLIARCDGQPIVWPEPTHFDPKLEEKRHRERGEKKRQAWRTAAECIDWSIPCHSIFLSKEQARSLGVIRPLAENTMRRIAKGIMRYVVNSADPFIVTSGYGERQGQSPRVPDINKPLGTVVAGGIKHALVTPFITEHANGSNQRNMAANEPLRTQCAQTAENRHALVSAFMAKHYGGVVGHDLHGTPLHTVTSSDHNSLVTAHMTKFRTGAVGSGCDEPVHTITAGGESKRPAGAPHALGIVTSHITKLRGTNIGQSNNDPLHTISAQGTHFAEVRAFLIKYYGNEQDGVSLNEPNHTVTARDRFGLVTVHGEEYEITDIGLRMLAPRELFRAQGFPENYIIDRGLHIDADGTHHWKPLTKSAQVRMCGNSVCPPLAAALVKANCPEMIAGVELNLRSA